MTIVLWHVTMSLDGFIAGAGDTMDWAFRYAERSAAADEVIRTTGAVLVGRRSYDVSRREHQHDPTSPAARPYGGVWTGQQFVLTHNPPAAPEDPTITFTSDPVDVALGRAREAAGDKNVAVIGATVARQCIDLGLVDEILVHLTPILLGDGVRFFSHPGSSEVVLQRTEVTQSGQLTDLRFRIVK